MTRVTIRERGNLKLRYEEGRGLVRVHLLACPACGEPFPQHSRRDAHISGHDPEDFGLLPVGERPPPDFWTATGVPGVEPV